MLGPYLVLAAEREAQNDRHGLAEQHALRAYERREHRVGHRQDGVPEAAGAVLAVGASEQEAMLVGGYDTGVQDALVSAAGILCKQHGSVTGNAPG